MAVSLVEKRDDPVKGDRRPDAASVFIQVILSREVSVWTLEPAGIDCAVQQQALIRSCISAAPVPCPAPALLPRTL